MIPIPGTDYWKMLIEKVERDMVHSQLLDALLVWRAVKRQATKTKT